MDRLVFKFWDVEPFNSEKTSKGRFLKGGAYGDSSLAAFSVIVPPQYPNTAAAKTIGAVGKAAVGTVNSTV